MSRRLRNSYVSANMKENRGSYNKISLELRTELIETVVQRGLSVYRASKVLSINNSTAKVIIRNFRKRGHVYRRKNEKKGACFNVYSEEAGINQFNQNNNSQHPRSNLNCCVQGQSTQNTQRCYDPNTCFYFYYPSYYINPAHFVVFGEYRCQ